MPAFISGGDRRWLLRALAIMLLAVGIYVGLRIVFGLKQPYAANGLSSIKGYWYENAVSWTGWVQALAFFNLALLFTWRGLGRRPMFLRRALWIVPVFAAIHLSVGNLCEIRYYLPLIPIFVPLTLMALEEATESGATAA